MNKFQELASVIDEGLKVSAESISLGEVDTGIATLLAIIVAQNSTIISLLAEIAVNGSD